MLNAPQRSADISMRDFQPKDAAAIQKIYAHYVANSVASFEETAPDVDEILNRHQSILDFGAAYIVAELDGDICGFAYASKFRPRSAYRHTVEDSIYVDPNVTGRGVGTQLLESLIERCTQLGFRQMVAVIGGTGNEASVNLHKRLGFEQQAVLKSIGFKFDAWADIVLMQLPLGEGDTSLPT
ncbi:MAG: N-acetyltransferase [Magnetovibrio sp.]|nr:N-acetyltransferase [Magnetovibrio sp.]